MRTREDIESNIQSGLIYDDRERAQTLEQVTVELLPDIREALLQMETCGHGTRLTRIPRKQNIAAVRNLFASERKGKDNPTPKTEPLTTKSDWRKARQYVQREYPSAHYTERGVVIAETLEIGSGSEPLAWLEAAARVRTHAIHCSGQTEFRIKSRVLRTARDVERPNQWELYT